MCQHSWYDKKRRHYGPKPNTRRERGLKRRDYGIKRGPMCDTSLNALPSSGIDTNVEPVELPKTWASTKRLISIYNDYVNFYDLYRDKETAIEYTIAKYHVRPATVEKAISVCKYLLASEGMY